MAHKVSNFSDLIQRVTSSCLLHPIGSGRHYADDISDINSGEDDSDYEEQKIKPKKFSDVDEVEEDEMSPSPGMETEKGRGDSYKTEREIETVTLMSEVFETVSFLKKAYVSLQQAHCPFDPDQMRSADVAVVAELRKLGVLRERFRRSVVRVYGGGVEAVRRRTVAGVTVSEVVRPYEAAMEKLKAEVKCKEAEINNLKEKLSTAAVNSGGSGRKSRSHSHRSKKKVSYNSQLQVSPSPMPELFESNISSVKEGSKSFTSLLLSLMKSAHWDIAATVRSIEASTATTTTGTAISTLSTVTDSIVGPNHAKYALESYVNRKIFQGFDHETFYMDGSLSSLLNPNQFRTDCFTQYRDMKAMDPIELLGILPSCQFGNFCSKKYLSIVHPKMEESLFGDLEQRRQVLAGNHPRTRFYGEFLVLAKAIWLLHLLAFSLDPPPTHFEGNRGAEFHPQYMESVVRFPGGRVAAGHVVGFPVSPGFKFGNGSIVKARVYVVPKSEV